MSDADCDWLRDPVGLGVCVEVGVPLELGLCVGLGERVGLGVGELLGDCVCEAVADPDGVPV